MQRDYLGSRVADGGVLDQYAAQLADSAAVNDALWIPSRSHADDIAVVKSYLSERLAWMDEQLASLDTAMESLGAVDGVDAYEKTAGVEISVEGATSDLWSYAFAADCSVAPAGDVAVTLDSAVAGAQTAALYVNGVKTATTTLEGGSAKASLSREAFAADGSDMNLVSAVLYDASGDVVATTYLTVAVDEPCVSGGVAYEGHVYETTAEGATCTSGGTVHSVCTRCGKVKDASVRARGHVWGAWATKGGTQSRTCSVCGEVESRSVVAVYRLYNPVTSEHLWTTDRNEYQELAKGDWSQEGVAWYSPASGAGVYRLYNPKLGTHHYTSNQGEVKELVASHGWVLDHSGNAVFYAATSGTAVYRLYNESLSQHLLTMSAVEYETLADYGWKQEGQSFLAYAK